MPPEYVEAVAEAIDHNWIIPDNESLDVLEIYSDSPTLRRNPDVMTAREIRQMYGTGLVR